MVDNSDSKNKSLIHAVFNASNAIDAQQVNTQNVLKKYGYENLIDNSYKNFLNKTASEHSSVLESAYKRLLSRKYNGIEPILESATPKGRPADEIISQISAHLIPARERPFLSGSVERANAIQKHAPEYLGSNEAISNALRVANLETPELPKIFDTSSNDYTAHINEDAKNIIDQVFKFDLNPETLKNSPHNEAKLLLLCRTSEALKTLVSAGESLSKDGGMSDDEKHYGSVMVEYAEEIAQILEMSPNGTALEKTILQQCTDLTKIIENAPSIEEMKQEQATISNAENVTRMPIPGE
ncbi:MAG: hypothetical protein ACRBDI_09900 [Alphaproteobacteria bacterium]